jgi:hypothetical protein
MLSNHPSVLGGGAVSVTTPAATSASLDLISSTQGAMLYRNATAWVGLGPGTSGQLLSTQGAAANPIWVTATGGAGDVNGPASATDNAIVRFDGTGGKTVQNSAVTIADTTGDIAGAPSLTAPATTDLTLSGGSTSGKILFNSPSATERGRFTDTGNLLIGTTTDMTGSGGLKVASTSGSTGSTSGAIITPGGIYAGAASVFGGALTNRIDQNAGTDLYVRNGATGTAAGSSFTAYDGTYVTQTGLLNTGFTTSGPYVANAGFLATNAPVGLRVISQTGEMRFYSSNTLALTLAASTQAATFAGAVAIGNTVAAGIAVASTHKVTMVIGGVTYYLLASNV